MGTDSDPEFPAQPPAARDRTLNLGILAHVDAGKTSLTERLLYNNGAIDHLGSVDSGSTQTDKSEIERRRGITIRSTVAAFNLGTLQVNLVDTPGHPDFIAEVERALAVLDGAILVVSAVEGVQAQTRILAHSLSRLAMPTLIFVNKIDQRGARYTDLLAEIRHKLFPSIVPLTTVAEIGTSSPAIAERSLSDEVVRAEIADTLSDSDDSLLYTLVIDDLVPKEADLRRRLARQTLAGTVQPVFFGSALTGAGTHALAGSLRDLLVTPQPSGVDLDPVSGAVFAIERTASGEKVGYFRSFSGTLHERERVTFQRVGASGATEQYSSRISGLDVITANAGGQRATLLTPDNIARIRGISQLRVGDRIGHLPTRGESTAFSPPILESVVQAVRPGDESAIHAALLRLAEEDPLIRTRTAGHGATSVLLYGAVQQQVIAERLQEEFGLDARFEGAQPVYFERPHGIGRGLSDFSPRGPNDFWQTVGLRVDRAPDGAGNSFTREVRLGLLPRGYYRAIEDAVFATLQQGLYGWEVTDCAVALTAVDCDPPMTVPGDFRNLTPIVMMAALAEAGTDLFEPGYFVEVDVPEDALSPVLAVLGSFGADLGPPRRTSIGWTIPGVIAARSLQDITKALPGLTHGEGSVVYGPGKARIVRAEPPTRPRLDGNPLDREEYLRFIATRGVSDRSVH